MAFKAKKVTRSVRRGPAPEPPPPPVRNPLDGVLPDHDGSVLAFALAYVSVGWPVFPCRANGKAPAISNGFKGASTDPDQLIAWFHDTDYNIGIATGGPGPDVVDIDRKEGQTNGFVTAADLEAVGLLPIPWFAIQTPSGGEHWYYPGTGQRNGSLVGHGIDFRGDGGYVLAPPSTIDGIMYWGVHSHGSAPVVSWPAIRRHVVPPPPDPGPSRGPREGPGPLSALVDHVRGLQSGNRNNGLYWAARSAVDEGHDPWALLVAAVEVGLTESEASQTIRSAVNGGARG